MAGTPTPRLSLPLPAETDPADVPADLSKLATALDSGGSGSVPGGVAYDNQGTLSALPTAGVRGRYYFATDVAALLRDNGTVWVPVTPNVVTTLPASPIAGQECYYTATDPLIGAALLWRLRYSGTPGSATPTSGWQVISGTPLWTGLQNSVTVASGAAWTAVPSPTAIVLPLNGIYDFTWGAEMDSAAAGGGFLYCTPWDFTTAASIGPAIVVIGAGTAARNGGNPMATWRAAFQGGHSYGLAFQGAGQSFTTTVRFLQITPVAALY